MFTEKRKQYTITIKKQFSNKKHHYIMFLTEKEYSAIAHNINSFNLTDVIIINRTYYTLTEIYENEDVPENIGFYLFDDNFTLKTWDLPKDYFRKGNWLSKAPISFSTMWNKLKIEYPEYGRDIVCWDVLNGIIFFLYNANDIIIKNLNKDLLWCYGTNETLSFK